MQDVMGIASVAMVLALAGGRLWRRQPRCPPTCGCRPISGIAGAPDRYSGKWVALLLPAGMAGGLSLLLWFLPALEPRLANLERSAGLYYWSWAALLLVSAAIEFVIVSTALHWGLRVEHVVAGAVGADVRADRQPARQVAQHVSGRHPHALDAGERGGVDPHPPARRQADGRRAGC